MSNAYEDWYTDRKEEAWTDLNRIVEIFEDTDEDVKYQGYYYDKCEEIKKILESGGWI